MEKYKNIVDEVRRQLLVEPYEDVYEKHFAGLSYCEELFDAFVQSFDCENGNISNFTIEKIRNFFFWVYEKFQDGAIKFCFPKFIDYYIECIYKEDGLRVSGIGKGNIVPYESEPGEFACYEFLIANFEESLKTRSWWSDYEIDVWENLQEKRRIVQEFEIYIYLIEDEILERRSEDNATFFSSYQSIYKKNIDSIKLEISRIKLFVDDVYRIPILENLANYLELKLINETYLLDVTNIQEVNLVRAEQTLKLNLLHQFGIVKHLERIWSECKISKPMSFLISTLISESSTSIQPRLSNRNDKKLRTDAGNRKLEKYLIEFGLELDQINYHTRTRV